MNTVDVKHDGLAKFRRITGSNRRTLEQLADAQRRIWDAQWQKRQEIERRHFSGTAAEGLQALKRAQAEDLTEEANCAVLALTSILLNTLRSPPPGDWAPLYDRSEFSEPPPPGPSRLEVKPEPSKREFLPPPPRNLVEMLSVAGRRRKKQAALEAFKNAHDEWEHAVQWTAREHDAAMRRYREAFADWDARNFAFHSAQAKANARLDALRQRYAAQDPEAVVGHCDVVLLSAERPEGFPRHWWTEFSNGALTVDYEMPTTDQIPAVKLVKYIAARDIFEVVKLSESEREQLYAEAVYQTCLAVLHLLFASDSADAVKSITFNGWVNFIDRNSARPGRACIMSVQTTKSAFGEIDLSSVDPRACFRMLNGTVSSKLAAMGGPGTE